MTLVSLDTLRAIGTVLAFVAFIAICLWAYSSKRRDDFEQAANLPFADEANDVPREENVA
jgi:cytochrome c oxidase cbb3-type subunit IV